MSALAPGVTSLGVASLITNAVFLPVSGWLFRNGIRTMKQSALQKAQLRDLEKKVTTLRDDADRNAVRLTRVEDAVDSIRKSVDRIESQSATMLDKLMVLPRLSAMLESNAQSMLAIVPRPEVDSRLRLLEERLRVLQEDFRQRSPA